MSSGRLSPEKARALSAALGAPDLPALPMAVRTQLEEAEEKMRDVVAMMRDHGWVENADDLMRTVRHLRAWTQAEGWLDYIGVPRRAVQGRRS